MEKPMKLFYSPISGRVYASKEYKIIKMGEKTYYKITGEKYDVTRDFMELLKEDIATMFPHK